MVSDSDLIARLHEFLRNSDLTTTSTATVRRKLEEDFGVDLTDKKVFIREQVDLFLQSEQERLAEIEQDGEEDDRTAEVQSQQSDVDDDDDDDDQQEVVEETSNGKRKKRSVIIFFSFSRIHILKLTVFAIGFGAFSLLFLQLDYVIGITHGKWKYTKDSN